MREIKFRGQGIKSSEWYYGDLIIANNPDRSKHYYIITNEYSDSDSGIPNTIELDTCNSPEVDQNTIGQYTGLKDNNGKEIYEGDIVEILAEKETWKDIIEEKLKLVVVFDEGEFLLKNEKSAFGPTFYHIRLCLKSLEVIGNIHDNPELLKEVQNEQ